MEYNKRRNKRNIDSTGTESRVVLGTLWSVVDGCRYYIMVTVELSYSYKYIYYYLIIMLFSGIGGIVEYLSGRGRSVVLLSIFHSITNR